MRQIATLLRKDLANFRRDKAALSLTFLVTIALIYIFGHVFGLNRKDSGPTGIRLAVVNASGAPAAQKLLRALEAEKAFRIQTSLTLPDKSTRPLTEADARQLILDRQLRFAVVIPPDIIRTEGIGVRLKFLANPQNEIESQTVNGLLQKTIFSSVPELLGQSLQAQAQKALGRAGLDAFNRRLATTIADAFGGDQADIQRDLESGSFGLTNATDTSAPSASVPPSSSNNNNNTVTPTRSAFSDLVQLETESVVRQQVQSPAATRLVGGWAIMFLLFALSGSATAFFEEKKTGIFQRLLSAPVRRSHLLWSRFLFGVGLGLVQLITLFLAGRVLYGIDVFGNFANLIIVSLAAAAACTAVGMLLVSITPTAAAASGLATFLVLVMSACGGAWFPISFMPPFMQEVAKFTLVYWALEGFSQVLWAGHSLKQLLPTLGILLGIAAAVMSVAIWRFNRGRLFE